MIRFDRLDEPAEFDAKARRPGLRWLEEHPHSKRPRDLWSPFKPDLAAGFGDLCAYSAMYEPVGTVDHFKSISRNRELAYEWSNLRFASGWINSSKRDVDQILDPFEIGEDWFEILLPSLQLVLTERVPSELRQRAEFTLERLHLRDDERVIRQRRAWLQLYEQGDLTLEGLHKMAPLIARAVARASGSTFRKS